VALAVLVALVTTLIAWIAPALPILGHALWWPVLFALLAWWPRSTTGISYRPAAFATAIFVAHATVYLRMTLPHTGRTNASRDFTLWTFVSALVIAWAVLARSVGGIAVNASGRPRGLPVLWVLALGMWVLGVSLVGHPLRATFFVLGSTLFIVQLVRRATRA